MKIFSFNKKKQARCFYTSLYFQCKSKCTVLIWKFPRFCRYSLLLFSVYFQWKQWFLNGVKSAILCFTKKKREAWLFWSQCTRLSSLNALCKNGSSMNDCIFLCYLFLFVHFDSETSLFFHRDNGTQYIYSAEFFMGTGDVFHVSVCVWAMLWSC